MGDDRRRNGLACGAPRGAPGTFFAVPGTGAGRAVGILPRVICPASYCLPEAFRTIIRGPVNIEFIRPLLGTPMSTDTSRSMKRPKRGVPEGLWQRCPGCQAAIFRKDAEKKLNVCPECEYHFYVSARERVAQILDAGTFEEWDADLLPTDPLGFADKKPYRERLVAEQQRTGLRDAAVTGTGMIRARRVAFGVTDSAFIMGSMGSVVGERLTRLTERATAQKLPLIIVSASGGGARMHEGIHSLMQMAKVSAALARHDDAGGLFISVSGGKRLDGRVNRVEL